MTPTAQMTAREAAERLHEHFEHVRSDPLEIPDSDFTESVIIDAARQIARHLIAEAGVEEALESCQDDYVFDGEDEIPTQSFNEKKVSAALSKLRALKSQPLISDGDYDHDHPSS